MKNALLAIATAAAVLTAAPLLAGTAKADPVRLAQADVDVRIGGRGGPGVVVDTPRRYHRGVVVTDGRSHCRTVTVREWRHGARITRTERQCG
jgi:hypothetical protein